jgi:hypothetical protein
MKQLHFWNTFKPKHWNELSKTQQPPDNVRISCFSRRNEMDPSREGLWLVETNNETTFPRKMQVHLGGGFTSHDDSPGHQHSWVLSRYDLIIEELM